MANEYDVTRAGQTSSTGSTTNTSGSAKPADTGLFEEDASTTSGNADTFTPSANSAPKSITIQKWGSEATDGNQKPNDCLWNIWTNYYKDQNISWDEFKKAAIAANPQIYDSGRAILGDDKTDVAETVIQTGETFNMPVFNTAPPAATNAAANNETAPKSTTTPAAAPTTNTTNNNSGQNRTQENDDDRRRSNNNGNNGNRNHTTGGNDWFDWGGDAIIMGTR